MLKDRLLNRFTIYAVLIAVSTVIISIVLHKAGITPDMFNGYLAAIGGTASAIYAAAKKVE